MADIKVIPMGGGRTKVSHSTGASFTTDSSPEWGGGGTSFSSTDLVAAGLGSCIGSSIARPLERRGVKAGTIRIEVKKTLADEPRRIEALHVVVHVPLPPDEDLETVLHRVASQCPVSRSLDVAETVEFRFEG